MRKYSALAPVLGIFLLASCEEKGPLINLTDVVAEQGDTTYVLSAIPAPQARNVLVEDFTGVSCPNCPAGHAIIKTLQTNHPGRIVAVGLYMASSQLAKPVENPDTEDDFRSPVPDAVNLDIYAGQANGLPKVGIDRMKYAGSGDSVRLLDRNNWTPAVESRLMVPSPVNLEATSDFNAADSTLKVKVTASFNAQVDKKVYFAVGIVQDSIIDAQEYPTVKVADYLHEHVFRGLITSQGVNGIELPFSSFYEAGRVFVRNINVPLFQTLRAQSPLLNSAYVKPGHCKVFVFVYHNDGNTKDVLQAIEVDML